VTEEVGKLGHVVTRIRGGEKPGEVTIPIRGGAEVYLAYCDQPVERSTPVLVIGSRGSRCLDVVPWTRSVDPLDQSVDPTF
jgi:hypothetical protein